MSHKKTHLHTCPACKKEIDTKGLCHACVVAFEKIGISVHQETDVNYGELSRAYAYLKEFDVLLGRLAWFFEMKSRTDIAERAHSVKSEIQSMRMLI